MEGERSREAKNRGDGLHVKEKDVVQTTRSQREPADGTKVGAGTERGE